jgi:FkbM family methyltransferase
MEPLLGKRLMRATWERLPRRAWSYKLAKALTRSVFTATSAPVVTDVRLADRFDMRIDLSEIVGNDLYCMGDHYEAPTLALWTALARDAATIVDLGSHIGLYACAAAAVNPRARILAVEAFAPNVAMLRVNAAQFPNVTPVHAAIAATTGRSTFRTSWIAGGGYLDDAARDAGGFAVDTIALDDFAAQQDLAHVDLLKIDLEGLEQPLLAGQEGFWRRTSPTHVIVEIATAPAPNGSSDLFDAMARRGYQRRRMERLHTIPWLRRDQLANWYFWRTA